MYRSIIKPILFSLTIERAHRAVLILLRAIGLIPGGRWLLRKCYAVKHPALEREVFGVKFANPVGLAAGFDHNGEAYRELAALGFGFIEIGTVTPRPQAGNPRPRVFRLPKDEAIINRFGLNSEGHSAIVPRLQKEYLRQQKHRLGLIGVNLADNKGTPDPVEDYIEGIKNCGPYSDFMVLIISCPNQVGTTALQQESRLREMLDRVAGSHKRHP